MPWVLTRKVVKIAVMNLQTDPLRVQGHPNRDAHVIWKLVTLLEGGGFGSKKSWPSSSPAIPVPNSMYPLRHPFPHHRTHCAADSPAHDDL